jgi:L-histidine Nalpha-methyltransferase
MTTYSIAIDPAFPASLDTRGMLIREVQLGLRRRPRSLSPWMFYDARGSRIFEDITELEEYYPTRTERDILVSHSDAIIAAACPGKSEAVRLVELGAGTAAKSTILLDAAVRL